MLPILSVEIRCLSDVVLRERREEQGHRGRGAAISINLAAKWTVGRLVSVQRTQRGATPPHKAHRSSQSDSISGGMRSRESSGKQHKTFKMGEKRS